MDESTVQVDESTQMETFAFPFNALQLAPSAKERLAPWTVWRLVGEVLGDCENISRAKEYGKLLIRLEGTNEYIFARWFDRSLILSCVNLYLNVYQNSEFDRQIGQDWVGYLSIRGIDAEGMIAKEGPDECFWQFGKEVGKTPELVIQNLMLTFVITYSFKS